MSNCLDMALRAFRAHFPAIALGWLAIGLPACGLVYAILDAVETNYLVGVIVFGLATAVYNAYLGAGMAAATFGEPFTPGSAWARVLANRGRVLWTALGTRLLEAVAALACFFPAIWVTVRYGFEVERRVLRDLGERRNDRAISELIGNSASDLIARWVVILLFSQLIWFSLSATFDMASEILLQRPIIHGRMQVDTRYFEDREYLMGYVLNLLKKDPAAITFLVAVGLAVYPLARLAWFFCLIDLRVRQDCWDIELEIEQEAERLAPVVRD